MTKWITLKISIFHPTKIVKQELGGRGVIRPQSKSLELEMYVKVTRSKSMSKEYAKDNYYVRYMYDTQLSLLQRNTL